MKCLRHILGLGLLLAAMVRCGNSPDSSALRGTTSQSGTAAHEALEEIDSLMWQQPDSALTVMLEFAASPEADSLAEFEGHYCQMLIAELLYKNDYEQSNREELLKTVYYFDSIVAEDGYKTDSHRDASNASAKTLAFLDARAHYINGVGYYERGDVVNACAEYLNALEVVEEHFEGKELIGEMALFMHIVYCRLLELFSAQFMMDPAIACGEQALAYCQKELMLSQEIPIVYYHIGKQYDKKGNRDVAINYYSKAIEGISNPQNVVYRNIISNKALCDYQVGLGIEQTVNEIKQLLVLSDNNNELLTRYLIIGGIYSEEGIYDSALRYLEPVFENKDDKISQILAANYLRCIYDSIGDQAKLNECTRFLADYKKPEGENKALVSKLEAMFKNYQNQKQEKEAEEAHKKSIRNTSEIIVLIAIMVALTVFIVAKQRSKQLLKQQQEKADRILGETEQEHEKELRRLQAEAEQKLADAEQKHQQKIEEIVKRHEEELKLQKDQSEQEIAQTRKRHEAELEVERLSYQKELEELQLSLQLSKRNVNTLQEELGRKRTDAEGQYEAFLKEPVCVKINDAVRDLQINTRKPYTSYSVSFDNETLAQFGLVVSDYYGEVKPALLCLYPNIAQEDLLLCYLYLLGMENKQIAVVRQREYSTVRKQAGELKRRLGIDKSVRDYVLEVAGVEELVEK